MIEITESSDIRITEFTHLRDRVLHDKNLIVCESEKLYLQLIHNQRPALKTLSTKKFAEKYQLTSNLNFFASKNILESIAGFKIEFDVLFLIEKPADYELFQLDDHIILLNGLSSPENVGSIVRSAAAFKVNSIITDEKTCSPFLRRCIRVSMGNIFSMRTYHSHNIRRDLLALKNLGYSIISTANIDRSLDLKTFQFPSRVVLIIGSEGHGIDHDILDISDFILKIKIDPQVAHLNASNAASIFLSRLSIL
ncbi:MAG: RNA methyltransferase [Bacteriovorax sp.]|jgi:tRNA G18 (ribose-2'-O)-methylase SpoU|nr:RNA methyltransferase [Bacteriovorax sp.]